MVHGRDISVYILDFSNIKQFSSAELGGLITWDKKSKAVGKRIILVGLRPNLIELLVTTKLDKLFEIYDNPKDAFGDL